MAVVLNLPLSICTKAPYIFMRLHIPKPKDPSKYLNVYLRPMIDELKVWWKNGVETYDRFSGSNFLIDKDNIDMDN